jgi:glycosyltransferase involved in cell wall biosynthesis
MARIVMIDDGIQFDGRTLDERPLGGAETSFIEMANALAARGHDVQAFSRCPEAVVYKGVHWTPLEQGLPETADLYIANRSYKLIMGVPRAKSAIFWIHNPASYLLKWRYQWRLFRRRPRIVFSGDSHASTYPAWGWDGGRSIVPYGVTEIFRHAEPRSAPPPRAVFTSNPLRSLDWLMDVWERHIHPAVPGAELHVFAGAATYGAVGQSKADRMGPILTRAQSLAAKGVVLRGPVPKGQLVDELAQARVLLYRGDIGETFCSAVAEAQAMGVPVVLEDIACMRERLVPAKTGFLTHDPAEFGERAVALLTDDALWQDFNRAALDLQRSWGWDEAARAFEALAGI